MIAWTWATLGQVASMMRNPFSLISAFDGEMPWARITMAAPGGAVGPSMLPTGTMPVSGAARPSADCG